MSTKRHLFFAIAGTMVLLVLGSAFLVWPNYRHARSVKRQINELNAKIGRFELDVQAVEKLAQDADAAHSRVQNECKSVPTSADIADVMRRLSMSPDGVTVKDQTFTAGTPASALTGNQDKDTVLAMPLTVDMKANFESIFDLLLRAESMQRLLRVTTIRIGWDQEDTSVESSLLSASIGLEAVYVPPAPSEGR